MECLKLWILNVIKLKSMMKARKANVPKKLYEKFLTQAKKTIA
jgi:hypothetical protein